MEEEKKKSIATIKVCVNCKCKEKGSEQIYQNLKEGLSPDEAIVLKVTECFGYCAKGPNIAINDNIVSGVKSFLAVETVRQELDNPSCKADGLGSKSLDELDSVLDDITRL